MRRAGFVDDVDGLVRHEPIGDIALRQFCGGTQGAVRVAHFVVVLESRLQALQYLVRVVDVGLDDVDLLEPSRKCTVLVEYPSILLVGRRTHAPDIAGSQQRLQHVRSIHDAAGCRPGTNNGVDLIDEEYGARLFLELVQEHLEALLKVAAVFRSRQQRT